MFVEERTDPIGLISLKDEAPVLDGTSAGEGLFQFCEDFRSRDRRQRIRAIHDGDGFAGASFFLTTDAQDPVHLGGNIRLYGSEGCAG